MLLKDFGDELFDKTGVAFRAEGIDEYMKEYNLPMDYKRHVVLIFKEVMNNALKHADCDNAVLKVDYQAPQLYIVFSDDGQGFEIPSASHNGNGLQNLQLRAEKIGAKLEIQSGRDGTRIGLNCEV